nr:PREDICTED: microtubule-associated protein futsch-like [Bemisia tabaci]XP_018905111.1 PREDICTED: microtubule-associated protein futsch-like [Bemisia tabaci]
MEAPAAGGSSAQGPARKDPQELPSNPPVGPPSPLSGAYLFVVIGEPRSEEDKQVILQKITKGFLSWDVESCHVDLEKELSILTSEAPEGEEAKNGERLIQYASENLVTEVLIHPQLNTMVQCIRNLLSSFTRHRHIIHAGYTFANSGSWSLQDGTFSLADFVDTFQEIEVQRVIRAYENTVTVDVHCAPEGEWNTNRLGKEQLGKLCKVTINPLDKLSPGSEAVKKFVDYLGQYIQPTSLEQLLEPSDVVGNIRFSHPTLYVFPGGQGDAALFGINGFNMLVDGGFSRKACFWNFVRHLDRLDAVLMTRINNSNINGISSLVKRKRENPVYPQIGHFFCNLQERKNILSPDGDKDKDRLLINLLDLGHDMVQDLRFLHLRPHPCYRDNIIEPINLYHKVGHGKLDMYVLSPAKDSREVREFISKWNTGDSKLFSKKLSDKDSFPLPNIVSICALLVWQPANPSDTITRILFPGSAPQHKILEGFERIRHLEFLKHPVCSAKSLSPSVSTVNFGRSSSKQRTYTSVEKSGTENIKTKNVTDVNEKTVSRSVSAVSSSQKSSSTVTSTIKSKVSNKTEIKKSELTEKKQEVDGPVISELQKDSGEKKETKSVMKADEKPKANIEKKEHKAGEVKPTQKTKTERSRIAEKKSISGEKESKSPPESPRKTSDTKINGKTDINRLRSITKTRSPSATPAKSTKEEKNRKVVESKTVTRTARSTSKPPVAAKKQPVATKKEEDKKETEKKEVEKKEADKKETVRAAPRPERKVVAKRKKSPEVSKEKLKSPMKAIKPVKSTKVMKKKQEDKEKSVVSAATEAVSTIERKAIAKALEEKSLSILAERAEIQSGRIEETIISMKNEQNISADGEIDEVLIIEKVELVPDTSMNDQLIVKDGVEICGTEEKDSILEDKIELQKQALDLLENEKIKKETEEHEMSQKDDGASDDVKEAEIVGKAEELLTADREDQIKGEVDDIITSATDIVSKNEQEAKKSAEVSSEEQKEVTSGSPVKISTPEKLSEEKLVDIKDKSKEREIESLPDEKVSTTGESGATTAPTMPEDEKIPLDNINETVEEKHVKEETKEDTVLLKKADEQPNLCNIKPDSEFIRHTTQSIRDIVKTPDEVADLPIHEEFDSQSFDEFGPEHGKPKDSRKSSVEKLIDSDEKDKQSETLSKADKDHIVAEVDKTAVVDESDPRNLSEKKESAKMEESEGANVDFQRKLSLKSSVVKEEGQLEEESPAKIPPQEDEDGNIDLSKEKGEVQTEGGESMVKTSLDASKDTHESSVEKEVSFEKPIVEDVSYDKKLSPVKLDIDSKKREDKTPLKEKVTEQTSPRTELLTEGEDNNLLSVEKLEIREKSDDELSEKGSPEKLPMKAMKIGAHDEGEIEKVDKTGDWSLTETSSVLPSIIEKGEEKESEEDKYDAKQKIELTKAEREDKDQDSLGQLVEAEPEFKTLRPGQVEYVIVTPDSTPSTPKSPSKLASSEFKHDTVCAFAKVEKSDDKTKAQAPDAMLEPKTEKQEAVEGETSDSIIPVTVEIQAQADHSKDESSSDKEDLKVDSKLSDTALPEDAKLPSFIHADDTNLNIDISSRQALIDEATSDKEVTTAIAEGCAATQLQDSAVDTKGINIDSHEKDHPEAPEKLEILDDKPDSDELASSVIVDHELSELAHKSATPVDVMKKADDETPSLMADKAAEQLSQSPSPKITSPAPEEGKGLEQVTKSPSPKVASPTTETTEMISKSPSPKATSPLPGFDEKLEQTSKISSPERVSPVPDASKTLADLPKSASPMSVSPVPSEDGKLEQVSKFSSQKDGSPATDVSKKPDVVSKSPSPVPTIDEKLDQSLKSPSPKGVSPVPTIDEKLDLSSKSPSPKGASPVPTIDEKLDQSSKSPSPKGVSPVPTIDEKLDQSSKSHSPKGVSSVPTIDEKLDESSKSSSPKGVSPVPTIDEKLDQSSKSTSPKGVSPVPAIDEKLDQSSKSPSPKGVSPVPTIDEKLDESSKPSSPKGVSPVPTIDEKLDQSSKSPSPKGVSPVPTIDEKLDQGSKSHSPKGVSPVPTIDEKLDESFKLSSPKGVSPVPTIDEKLDDSSKSSSPKGVSPLPEASKTPEVISESRSPKAASPDLRHEEKELSSKSSGEQVVDDNQSPRVTSFEDGKTLEKVSTSSSPEAKSPAPTDIHGPDQVLKSASPKVASPTTDAGKITKSESFSSKTSSPPPVEHDAKSSSPKARSPTLDSCERPKDLLQSLSPKAPSPLPVENETFEQVSKSPIQKIGDYTLDDSKAPDTASKSSSPRATSPELTTEEKSEQSPKSSSPKKDSTSFAVGKTPEILSGSSNSKPTSPELKDEDIVKKESVALKVESPTFDDTKNTEQISQPSSGNATSPVPIDDKGLQQVSMSPSPRIGSPTDGGGKTPDAISKSSSPKSASPIPAPEKKSEESTGPSSPKEKDLQPGSAKTLEEVSRTSSPAAKSPVPTEDVDVKQVSEILSSKAASPTTDAGVSKSPSPKTTSPLPALDTKSEQSSRPSSPKEENLQLSSGKTPEEVSKSSTPGAKSPIPTEDVETKQISEILSPKAASPTPDNIKTEEVISKSPSPKISSPLPALDEKLEQSSKSPSPKTLSPRIDSTKVQEVLPVSSSPKATSPVPAEDGKIQQSPTSPHTRSPNVGSPTLEAAQKLEPVSKSPGSRGASPLLAVDEKLELCSRLSSPEKLGELLATNDTLESVSKPSSPKTKSPVPADDGDEKTEEILKSTSSVIDSAASDAHKISEDISKSFSSNVISATPTSDEKLEQKSASPILDMKSPVLDASDTKLTLESTTLEERQPTPSTAEASPVASPGKTEHSQLEKQSETSLLTSDEKVKSSISSEQNLTSEFTSCTSGSGGVKSSSQTPSLEVTKSSFVEETHSTSPSHDISQKQISPVMDGGESLKPSSPVQGTMMETASTVPQDILKKEDSRSSDSPSGKESEQITTTSPSHDLEPSSERVKSSASHELELTPRSASPAESSKAASPIPPTDKKSDITSSTSISPVPSPTFSVDKEKESSVSSQSLKGEEMTSKTASPGEDHLSPARSPSPPVIQLPKDETASSPAPASNDAPLPESSSVPTFSKEGIKSSSPNVEAKSSPKSSSPSDNTPKAVSPSLSGTKTPEVTTTSPSNLLSSVPPGTLPETETLAFKEEIASKLVSSVKSDEIVNTVDIVTKVTESVTGLNISSGGETGKVSSQIQGVECAENLQQKIPGPVLEGGITGIINESEESIMSALDSEKISSTAVHEGLQKLSSLPETTESIKKTVSPSADVDTTLKTVSSVSVVKESKSETLESHAYSPGTVEEPKEENDKTTMASDEIASQVQKTKCSATDSSVNDELRRSSQSLEDDKEASWKLHSKGEESITLSKEESTVSTTTISEKSESVGVSLCSKVSGLHSSSDESEQPVEKGFDLHSSTQSTCGSSRTTGSTPPVEEITEGLSHITAKDEAESTSTTSSFTSFIKSGFETVVGVLHDATKTASSAKSLDEDNSKNKKDEKLDLTSEDFTACSKDLTSSRDASVVLEEPREGSSVLIESEGTRLSSSFQANVISDSADLSHGGIEESVENICDNKLASPSSKSFSPQPVHTSPTSIESSEKIISTLSSQSQILGSTFESKHDESSHSISEQIQTDSHIELVTKKQSTGGSPTSDRSSKSSSPLPPSDLSSKHSSPIPPNDQSPKSDQSFKDTDKSLNSLPTDRTAEMTPRLSITDSKLDTSSIPAYSRSSALSTSAPSPDESLTSVSPISGTDKSSKPISPLLSTDETTKSTVHEETSLKLLQESAKQAHKFSGSDLSEKEAESLSASVTVGERDLQCIITKTDVCHESAKFSSQTEDKSKGAVAEKTTMVGEESEQFPTDMTQSFYSYSSHEDDEKLSLQKTLTENLSSFDVQEIKDHISKNVIEELKMDQSSEILKSFITKSKSELGVTENEPISVNVFGEKLKAEDQVRSKSFDASPFRGRPMHEVVPDCQPIHTRLPPDQVKKIETLIEKHGSGKESESSCSLTKAETSDSETKMIPLSDEMLKKEVDDAQSKEICDTKSVDIRSSDFKIVGGSTGKEKMYTSYSTGEDQHIQEEGVLTSGIIAELRREAHDLRSSTPGSEASDRDYELGDRSTPQSDLSSGQISRAGMQMWRPGDSDEELPGSPMSTASHVTHSPSHSEYETEGHKMSSVMTSSLYGALPETFEQSSDGNLGGHEMYSSVYVPKEEDEEEEEIENLVYSSEYSKQFLLKSDEMIDFDKAMKEHKSKRGEELGSYMTFSSGGHTETSSSRPEHLSDDIGNGNISVDNNINRSIPLEHTDSTFTTVSQGTTTSTHTISQSIYPAETHSHTTSSTSHDNDKDPIGGWGKPLGLPPPPNNINNQNKRILIWNPVEEWGKPLGLPSPAPPPGKEDSNGDIQVDLTPLSNKTTPKKAEKKSSDKNTATGSIGKESKRRSESPMKHRSWSRDGRGSKFTPIYIDLAYVPHHGNSLYSATEFFKRIRARYYVFSAVEPSKEIFDALLEAKQSWEDKDSEVTIIPTYDTDALGYWVSENEELLVKHKIDLSPSASRCTINLQDHETSCSAYRLEF